jgi:hypothetical protein
MNFQAMSKQRKFILIAAAAGLIAMFLPWVSISTGNLLDGASAGDNELASAMSSSTNGMHGAGILVFISFSGALILSLAGEQTKNFEKTNWLAAIITGGAAMLATIVMLANTPSLAMGFVKSSVGWGAWTALLASAGVLASALIFKNPGDSLKDSFDKLKKDLAFATGPQANNGALNGTSSASGSVTATGDPAHAPAATGGPSQKGSGTASPDNSNKMDQLVKLIELKSQGKITEEEYRELKSKIL